MSRPFHTKRGTGKLNELMTNGLFTPREKPIFIEMNEKQIARIIDGADQQPNSRVLNLSAQLVFEKLCYTV